MILSEQIKRLLGPFWSFEECSANHIKFKNKIQDDYCIEVKKQESRRESNLRIYVTVPLEQVNFTTVFYHEMPAYEYIEDFVYDTMEKGVEFGEQMIEPIKDNNKNYNTNDIKRRRFSSSSCSHRIEPDWGWGWNSDS